MTKITFPPLPSKTFVSNLEWWELALISKLEFGLSMIMSASDPTRIAPFLGYILKILALENIPIQNHFSINLGS